MGYSVDRRWYLRGQVGPRLDAQSVLRRRPLDVYALGTQRLPDRNLEVGPTRRDRFDESEICLGTRFLGR